MINNYTTIKQVTTITTISLMDNLLIHISQRSVQWKPATTHPSYFPLFISLIHTGVVYSMSCTELGYEKLNNQLTIRIRVTVRLRLRFTHNITIVEYSVTVPL
ncbi:hypothetical protein EB796_013008 [Bugula neritina]|uniref:Uncharacterized protein n=1 Tax=Bugula neritina TaxID=10212 RepID=A0A7J7JRQ9_BUGNE|nr:hypothetical protein EB796_013008 [Bugula neritina]